MNIFFQIALLASRRNGHESDPYLTRSRQSLPQRNALEAEALDRYCPLVPDHYTRFHGVDLNRSPWHPGTERSGIGPMVGGHDEIFDR